MKLQILTIWTFLCLSMLLAGSSLSAQSPGANIFVSSNLQNQISYFNIQNDVPDRINLAPIAADADGIYYDQAADVLYQLNRTDNVINAYSSVSSSLTLTATSSSDFANGREIAVVGNKLVVAQDASPANGDQNRLLVYTISPTMITLDKIYDVSINLWGIHADGNTLYAVVDNSSMVATFNDFFSQPAGALAPSSTVSVDGLVRTHGITYDPIDDIMILTDIGDPTNATDGFLIVVRDFATASADGSISAAEQFRAGGPVSQLGNPVDVAFDKAQNRVYVAERASEGGKFLCFKLPNANGSIVPRYSAPMAGASAVNLGGAPTGEICGFVDGGNVSLATGGTTTTIFIDGEDDFISFNSTADAVAGGFSFTYVVTDDAGMILGIPPGNTVNFEPAGTGACNVYGLSYTGNLNIMMGDDLFSGAPLSDDCFELSGNNIVVNRITPTTPDTRFFVSSNNQMAIGSFGILADNAVTMSMFANEDVDADGIHYDADADVLYQLNRTSNVINAYSNASTNPTLTATSTSDFINGREIAVVDGKLVVAQDANPANGEQNRFIIYDVSPTAITLDKIYDAAINLWGIHANGGNLFAIVDNSNQVAVFNNFFNQPAGNISPSMTISVEGLDRTHGITYDAADDLMILTDIGDALSATDGALVVIKDFMTAGNDSNISASEQIRVGGASSQLGNPVDVAYDKAQNRIYVAERANGGGKVLGFKFPRFSGGIAPSYVKLFAGASAITLPGEEVGLCDFVTGQTLGLAAGGTTTTITIDGEDDFISFESDYNTADGYFFTYVVTDDMGIILGIPPAGTVNFEPAGTGACNVYGVSYSGILNIMVGDDLFAAGAMLSDDCFALSTNNLTVNRISPEVPSASFFVSSNSQMAIGAFDVLSNNTVTMTMFANAADDADGIYYDDNADVIYQLNRTDNVINAYSNASSANPALTATSTSDFINGREIAVVDGKLVVAQDANPANGNQNRFVVYDVSPTAITLDKIYDASINLWGIHANGGNLFAIVDNSSQVAVFNNFFNQPAGAIAPSMTVAVDGLIRTHGLTYDAEDDVMILTDIGNPASATDGALIVVKDFMTAGADGTISTSEQIRVGGASSQLGNPVDVAYDEVNNTIYVAERASGNGKVLGFKFPRLSGGIAPFYSKLFFGASAIHLPSANEVGICDFVQGQTLGLDIGGTTTTIIIDGDADFISFNSDYDAADGYSFTYVVTDDMGMILGIPPGNMVDFDPAGVGACNVYGLSYTGNLNIMMGDDLFAAGAMLSDDCFALSDNNLTVNRVAPQMGQNLFYVSSNTQMNIGGFSVLGDNSLAMTMFQNEAEDADGIFYDQVNDVIYQLNRTDNVINAFSNVSTNPTLTATSTSDFINGREITVADGKLVVAQDASPANGDQNRFIIYDISPTSITLDKIYDTGFNLWGIHADAGKLYAIVDNSNQIAVYDDFFNEPAGTILSDLIANVDGIVRTHGITYDAARDIMILTDIGDPMSPTDGALVVIKKFSLAAIDSQVSADEQIRVEGPNSQLGNPVDVAYDRELNRIFVAERANGGGKILGFKFPGASSSIVPLYSKAFAGASAIHLAGVVSSTNSIVDDGTSTPADIRSEKASLDNTNITIGKIFPVPANDLLNVEITSAETQNTLIQIFDVTGVLKFTQPVTLVEGNNTVTLNLIDLNVGVHFVRIPGVIFNGNFIKNAR